MKRLRRQQLADHAGGQCWAPGILTPGLLPQEEMGVGRVPPGPAGLVRGGPGFASSLEGLCVPAGSAPASPHTPCLWAARHHPELKPSSGPRQRRQWHPTPVLLPGKSHGQRSLVGCSLWGRSEVDTAERLHFHFSLSGIGEGNGNPLQCSCLENPRYGEAWWAAVYGVAQSRTRLK